jgi:hypothetical protein
VKLFYALRQVVQHRREQNTEPLDRYLERFLERLGHVRGLEGVPRSLSEFERSIVRQFGTRLPDWRRVPDAWLRPTRQGAFTNEIHRRVSEYRDRHMIQLLAGEVRRGQRVFAVVGFSHVVMQEPALRALLR